MPKMIRKGDKTSHGGTVLEGFSCYMVDGLPASGMGHQVACPLCKGVFPIVEGNPSHTCFSVPLAYHGMKTACGATLISSYTVVEHSHPKQSPSRLSDRAMLGDPLNKHPDDRQVEMSVKEYYTSDPIENTAYGLRPEQGGLETGATSNQGLSKSFKAEKVRGATLNAGKNK